MRNPLRIAGLGIAQVDLGRSPAYPQGFRMVSAHRCNSHSKSHAGISLAGLFVRRAPFAVSRVFPDRDPFYLFHIQSRLVNAAAE